MIMSPTDSRLRYWQTFMVVMVAYSAWTYPFEAAYLRPSAQSLKKIDIVDSIINFFFLFDIILNFFVAYFDKKRLLLVRDPKSIARRYLSTWFIPDVASTLPIELVSYFLNGKYSMCLLYTVMGLIRLSRLRHVERFFNRLEMDIRFSYFWVICARLLYVTLFSVHYHSITLLNPHKYLHAGHVAEKLFLIIYMLFSFFFAACAIGRVIATIYMLFDGRTMDSMLQVRKSEMRMEQSLPPLK